MKHAINWFEIPSADFDRAVAFYSTILDAPLRREVFGGTPNGVFAYEQDEGKDAVGGAVIFDPRSKPGMTGVIPYLNCDGKLDAVLGRVEKAGGKVLLPKTDIGFGHIGLILDTEGNKVGLHAA